jgi:hypothetical protein
MPLLSYHSALPLDLWDLPASLFKAMTGLVWYLMAFLASRSNFSGNGAGGVAAQYLLGLGESLKAVCESRNLSHSLQASETSQGISIHSKRQANANKATTQQSSRRDKHDGSLHLLMPGLAGISKITGLCVHGPDGHRSTHAPAQPRLHRRGRLSTLQSYRFHQRRYVPSHSHPSAPTPIHVQTSPWATTASAAPSSPNSHPNFLASTPTPTSPSSGHTNTQVWADISKTSFHKSPPSGTSSRPQTPSWRVRSLLCSAHTRVWPRGV